jgi:hypothetical protein
MNPMTFQCPACGFQIFNRRVPKCEACEVTLPEELLFSAEEIAALDAQFERGKKDREEQKRKIRRTNDFTGSLGGVDGSGGFDGGGDGGGCD